MVWIYVTLGVALVGLVLLGWYVVRLYRKLGAVLTELAVLAGQAEQVLDLLARIEVPDSLGDRYDASFALDDDLWAEPGVAVGRRT